LWILIAIRRPIFTAVKMPFISREHFDVSNREDFSMADNYKIYLLGALLILTIFFVARYPAILLAFVDGAGATARCRDGSLSFSEHRCGTCSHHGGVTEFLPT
jgi:hypothetical protein